MLDVHPPEHPAHSWRDFLVHIATIVVGLLIAIGLEQTVEFVHRRSEVRETRERIRKELEMDRKLMHENEQRLRTDSERWRNFGAQLVDPRIDADKVSKMEFSWSLILEPNSAWENARQSTVFDYLPPSENQEYAYLYRVISENYSTSTQYISDVRSADAIVQRVRATHVLDPDDRERLLALTDALNARARNQLDLYVYLGQALGGWLDHGRVVFSS